MVEPVIRQATMSRVQVILVMGVTGVGKSTFIRHATGLDVKVGHGQSSCKYFLRGGNVNRTNGRPRY